MKRILTGFDSLYLALRAEQRAVTAIEYALVAALIAVVIIAGVSQIGTSLTVPFNTIATTL